MWASAWLAGYCSPDDVLDALHEWAPMHLLRAGDPGSAEQTGLPWPDAREAATLGLLETVRDATAMPDAELRLVLPVAGDVRGLPTGGAFAAAAITAGEAVLTGRAGDAGVGIVPLRSGPDVLCWNVFALELPPAAEAVGLGEAEYAMRTAMRDAAAALVAVQRLGAPLGVDPRAAMESLLEASARHRLPPTVPDRAVRILDSADRVAAILAVAQQASGPAALSATGANRVDDLLRPLHTAVRAARLSAIAGAVRAAASERG